MQTLNQQLTKLRNLLKEGQQQTAIETAENIQQQFPDSQDVAWILAKLYQEQNDLISLKAQLELIHSNFPSDSQALLQLANIHYRKKEQKTALEYIDKAEKLAPDDLKILNHKSAILNELFRYHEAIETLQRSLEISESDAYVWSNLGLFHQTLGLYEKAEGYFLRAIEMAGDKDDSAYNNMILLNHYIPHSSPKKIFNLLTRWERKFASNISKMKLDSHDTSPDKKIRIGLLSDGLRTHPVGQMITKIIEQLPKSELELYAYSMNLKEDNITKRIKNNVSSWKTVDHLGHKDLAEEIIKDNIDILFDLSGHMSGSRMKSLAMKPAPILIKWVGGLINTTGLSTMDYLLSDSVETPVGVDEWYTEKLIRMPHGYVCYEAPSYSHDVYSPPALRNGYITLGCFNNPQKINHVVLEQWAKIMHRLPDSKLFLKSYQFNSPTLVDNVKDTMAGFGITEDRLIIEGPSSHSELLKAYNKVDIALDPWPYSGGLTTCEAMFMGVPVVTYPGPTFAGRHSATHLTNVGLGQLVTNSWEEYCDLVINLANDPENLANIRKHLRGALLESPLCDAQSFARHFSNAMRAIWQRHCEGKSPAALTLDEEGNCQFENENQPVTLQLPTASEQETIPAEESDFSFNFTGQIIALEHGATLASRPHFRDFLRKGAVNYICLDPGGVIRNAQQLQHTGLFQHFPLTVLGDGSEMELALAVEAERSTTLPIREPDPNAIIPEQEPPALISTKKVTSNRIDDIDGLDHIDWLILDGQHNNLSILENGKDKLCNTLLLEVGVDYKPNHSKQLDFANIKSFLNSLGLKLIKNKKDHSKISETAINQAVFIPDESRINSLNKNQIVKLSFLLDSLYNLKEQAYQLLKNHSLCLAKSYLESLSPDSRKQINISENIGQHKVKNNVLSDASKPDIENINILKYGRYTHSHSRICVGVPIFNEADYLTDTLTSLKHQNLDDVHFIIIDNASTDKSISLCLDLIGDDDRFTLLQQKKNIGAMPNFQAAFDLSQSKYFMWLGGHDYLSNDYLAYAAAELDCSPQTAMVLGQPHAVLNGQQLGLVKEALYDFSSDSPLERYLLSVAQLNNCTVFHSMFRRQALQNHALRKTISADHVTISRLLWHGKLHFMEEAVYYRRYFSQRNNTQSERISGTKEYLSRYDFYNFYLDDFAKLYSGDSRMQRYLEGKILSLLEQRFGTSGLLENDSLPLH